MTQPSVMNGEACERTLIHFVYVFQFLGDPHLTISHVNYKLDQVRLIYVYIFNIHSLTGQSFYS